MALSLAVLQPTSPSVAQTASPAARSALTVHLMTVIDNPDILGGQRVRVPDVAVRQILSPRLVIVSEPRVLGIDRTYRPEFRFDKLLVALPATAPVSLGQVLTVTGDVRALAAARSLGVNIDDRMLSDQTWGKRAIVLIADSAESVDGTVLVGGQSR
jgi:hypothetical protein